MDLCSRNHPEICYDESRCPLCDEISDHKDSVEKLEAEISRLKEELDNERTP